MLGSIWISQMEWPAHFQECTETHTLTSVIQAKTEGCPTGVQVPVFCYVTFRFPSPSVCTGLAIVVIPEIWGQVIRSLQATKANTNLGQCLTTAGTCKVLKRVLYCRPTWGLEMLQTETRVCLISEQISHQYRDRYRGYIHELCPVIKPLAYILYWISQCWSWHWASTQVLS